MTDYDETKNAPMCWWNKAEQMESCAKILWTHAGDNCLHIVNMLSGLALEACFKTILVNQNIEVPGTHKLEELAAAAGVDYEDGEKLYLQYLTASVRWDGKYPVPFSESEYESMIELETDVRFQQVPFSKGSSLMMLAPSGEWTAEKFEGLFAKGKARMIETASWMIKD